MKDKQNVRTEFLEHSKEFDLIKAQKQYFSQRMWKDYTLQELGSFVHLLCKRAAHRIPREPQKALDDINDAQVYATIILVIIENLADDASTLMEDLEDLKRAREVDMESKEDGFITEDEIKKKFGNLKS